MLCRLQLYVQRIKEKFQSAEDCRPPGLSGTKGSSWPFNCLLEFTLWVSDPFKVSETILSFYHIFDILALLLLIHFPSSLPVLFSVHIMVTYFVPSSMSLTRISWLWNFLEVFYPCQSSDLFLFSLTLKFLDGNDYAGNELSLLCVYPHISVKGTLWLLHLRRIRTICPMDYCITLSFLEFIYIDNTNQYCLFLSVSFCLPGVYFLTEKKKTQIHYLAFLAMTWGETGSKVSYEVQRRHYSKDWTMLEEMIGWHLQDQPKMQNMSLRKQEILHATTEWKGGPIQGSMMRKYEEPPNMRSNWL